MREEIATAARTMSVLGAIALAACGGGAGSSGASGGSGGGDVGGGDAASDQSAGGNVGGGGTPAQTGGTRNSGGESVGGAGNAGAGKSAGGAGGDAAIGPLSCDANFTIRNVAFYGDTGVTRPPVTSCPGVTLPVATITSSNVTTAANGVIVYGSAPYNWAAYEGQQPGQLPVMMSVDAAGELAVRSSLYSADGSYAYAAAGFLLAGTGCVNASQYTGVRFELTGDFGNCTVLFQVEDPEDSDASASSGKGECRSGPCSAPYFQIAKPGVYQVPFSMLTGGIPDSAADSASILSVQWLLSVGQ